MSKFLGLDMFHEKITEALKEYFISNTISRNSFNIHASDIYSFCPRRFALANINKITLRNPPIRSAMTGHAFAVGVAIEKMVLEAFAYTNMLIGKAKCPKCSKEYAGKVELLCPECKIGAEYEQLSLELPVVPPHCFKGSIDMFVEGTNKVAYALECKSIGESPRARMAFNDLVTPLLEHTYQVQSYLYLISKLKPTIGDIRVADELAALLYISKSAKHVPYKLFLVKKDKVIQREIADFIKEVVQWNDTKILPKRIGKTKLSYICSHYCPKEIVSICFKQKD